MHPKPNSPATTTPTSDSFKTMTITTSTTNQTQIFNHKCSTHTHKSTTNLQPIPTNQTQINLIPNSHFHELFIPNNQIEKHQLHNLFIPTNQIKKPSNP